MKTAGLRPLTAIQVVGLACLFILAAVGGLAYEVFLGRAERRRAADGRWS